MAIKLQEYDKSIRIIDSLTADVEERLAQVDPASEEYSRLAANLKTLQESKREEIECKNSYISGKVPSWMTGLLGVGVSLLCGGVVLREEKKGGVVSSQAVNVWDKLSRKFW
jgi:hypothetical protein